MLVCAVCVHMATIKGRRQRKKFISEASRAASERKSSFDLPMFNIARAALFIIFLTNSIGIFFFGRANMQKRLAIAWCSPLLLIITVNLFALQKQIVQKCFCESKCLFCKSLLGCSRAFSNLFWDDGVQSENCFPLRGSTRI